MNLPFVIERVLQLDLDAACIALKSAAVESPTAATAVVKLAARRARCHCRQVRAKSRCRNARGEHRTTARNRGRFRTGADTSTPGTARDLVAERATPRVRPCRGRRRRRSSRGRSALGSKPRMATLEEPPVPLDPVHAVGAVPKEVLERAERDDRVVARGLMMFLPPSSRASTCSTSGLPPSRTGPG